MTDMFEQIKLMKSNRHYRVGDIVLQRGARWEHDRDIILKDLQYSGTILKQYLQRKTKSIDIITLANILRNYTIKTDNNTLYVNLRLGDCVMSRFNNIDDSSYGRMHKMFIFHPCELTKHIVNTIDCFKNINNIQIVAVLNFGDNDINNWWKYSDQALLENKKRVNIIFESIDRVCNLPVSIIQSLSDDIQQIDRDFVILSTARHVVIDNSHFGQLINTIRSINNK